MSAPRRGHGFRDVSSCRLHVVARVFSAARALVEGQIPVLHLGTKAGVPDRYEASIASDVAMTSPMHHPIRPPYTQPCGGPPIRPALVRCPIRRFSSLGDLSALA